MSANAWGTCQSMVGNCAIYGPYFKFMDNKMLWCMGKPTNWILPSGANWISLFNIEDKLRTIYVMSPSNTLAGVANWSPPRTFERRCLNWHNNLDEVENGVLCISNLKWPKGVEHFWFFVTCLLHMLRLLIITCIISSMYGFKSTMVSSWLWTHW